MEIADVPILDLVFPIRKSLSHVRPVFLFVERDNQIGVLEVLDLDAKGKARILAERDPSTQKAADRVFRNRADIVRPRHQGNSS